VLRIDGEKQVASREHHCKGSLCMSAAAVSAAIPGADLFPVMGISLVFPTEGDPVRGVLIPAGSHEEHVEVVTTCRGTGVLGLTRGRNQLDSVQ
jgi:hypothetical protein